jgi:hypothetical protein
MSVVSVMHITRTHRSDLSLERGTYTTMAGKQELKIRFGLAHFRDDAAAVVNIRLDASRPTLIHEDNQQWKLVNHV